MFRIPEHFFLHNTPEYVIKSLTLTLDDFNSNGVTAKQFESESLHPKDSQGMKLMEQRLNALMSLGSHPIMEEVWEKLEKVELKRGSDFRVACFYFVNTVCYGLHMEPLWAELTPKAREAKHAKIIRTMQELAKDINDYELDQEDIPDREGKPCNGGWHHPDYEASLSIPPITHNYKDLYNNQTGIQISDLLQKHANKLEQEKRHQYTLTCKTTGGDDRRLVHFIRTLGVHNISRYGELHGALISRVACVFFPNSDTEPEKIRACFKAFKL